MGWEGMNKHKSLHHKNHMFIMIANTHCGNEEQCILLTMYISLFLKPSNKIRGAH